MKKLISAILVFMVLTGCSSGTDVQESERISRISSAPIDPEILGRWENESNGYYFDEDRKVSLIMNFSAMGNYFTSDGDFQMAGGLMTKEQNIAYDGTNLNIICDFYDETDNTTYSQFILCMERTDEPDTENYDGTYKVLSGACVQAVSDIIGMSIEDIIDNITLEAEVRGESFVITAKDYCDYETNENSLELFSQYMNYIDESATSVKYDYKIEKDTLTLNYADSENTTEEIYKRVEETYTED